MKKQNQELTAEEQEKIDDRYADEIDRWLEYQAERAYDGDYDM